MEKRRRNHHIVPKSLQKHFATDTGHIWYAEKSDNGTFCQPELRNPISTFVIRNHYTILESGRESDRVEKNIYEKLDDYFGVIIPQIKQAQSSENIPVFEEERLSDLRQAVIFMVRRTPDFRPEHDDMEYAKAFFSNEPELIPEIDENYPASRVLTLEEQYRRIGRNARVWASIELTERMETALDDLTVSWAIPDQGSSFISSRKMVTIVGNGGPANLKNPNVEIWMPLTREIALVLRRDPERRISKITRYPKERVRQFNEHAALHSGAIGSHSQRLIESITRKRAKPPQN